MEISIDRQAGNYEVLSVKVYKEDYTPEFNKKLKEYAKKVNLKGFRPGKAPVGMVKKMVGKDLKAEVFNKTIADGIDNYLNEQNVKPFTEPRLKEENLIIDPEFLDSHEEISLTFEFISKPSINFSMDDLSQSDIKIEPTAEEVDNFIEEIRQEFKKTITVDSIEQGDFIKGVFQGSITTYRTDGTPLKEPLLYPATLPLNRIIEGKRELLLGKKTGEEVALDLSQVMESTKEIGLLLNEPEDEVNNLPILDFKIEEITRQVNYAADDQEFFDGIFGKDVVSSPEAFKEKIKESLIEREKSTIDYIKQIAIRSQITKSYPFDINEEYLMSLYNASSKKEEEKNEEITEEEKAKKEEEKKKNAEKYIKQFKWLILFNKISETVKVEITEQDVIEVAKTEFINMLGGPRAAAQFPPEFLDSYMPKFLEGKSEKEMSEFYEKAHSAKLWNKLIEDVAKKDEKILNLAELGKEIEKIEKELV